MSLVTYHLLFTCQVVTPLELDEHSGSALRGMLFESVWRRFCTNKAAPECAVCPLHAACPVSALVAPLREEHQRGRDIARPYVILPPLGTARRYERGQTLIFGLTLFGTIIQLLPYIILSLDTLETSGLGRKLAENHGHRGTFRIISIDSYHPLTKERVTIYQQGKPLVQTPTLAVTPADVALKAATLSTETLTLHFRTPTRLVEQATLVTHPDFRPLVLRLLERLTALEAAYGERDESITVSNEDLVKLASTITCSKDETSWEEVRSYSSRQKSFTHLSGFLGKATFAGALAPFRSLLSWGELVHVGKNVVKGNGWYSIVEAGSP
jgi:hypothetical protein